MKKSQFFAVSQFLTDWPDGWDFDQVTAAVAADNENIIRWEMVETWDSEDLAEAIEMCEKAFTRTVADILNEEKNPQPENPLSPYFGDVNSFLRDHLTIISVKG